MSSRKNTLTYRNSLELLGPLVPDPRFTMTCLAVEAAISVKSASAMSKRILKTDSENLLLWNAHARLERLKGKTATARKVYATALAAAVLRQTRPDEDEIDLWQAWLEMENEDGDPQAVLTLFALRDQERIGMLCGLIELTSVQYGSGAISFSQIERLRCKKVSRGGGCADAVLLRNDRNVDSCAIPPRFVYRPRPRLGRSRLRVV